MNTSVIIPTYNRAAYVHTILDALDAGSVVPTEVVIVDDSPKWTLGEALGSRDDSFELVYIKRPDLGFRVASARNAALSVARGDLIIAIQDATLPSVVLVAEYLECFEDNSEILAFGYVRNVLGDPNSDDRHEIWDDQALWKHGWGRNFAITRANALKLMFDPLFDGAYGFEDVDFSFRAYQAGLELTVVPEAWCLQLPRKHVASQLDQGDQLGKFVLKNGVWP